MNKAIAQQDFLTLMRLCPTLDEMEGDVVVVVIKYGEAPNLADALGEIGRRLLSDRVGELDRVVVNAEAGTIWAFYNCPCATAALPKCKTLLAELELLDAARILYALPATNICPQYWPEETPRFAGMDHLAFTQNLDAKWFGWLSKLRLDILLVHFNPPPSQCIEGDLPEKFGEALRRANAGGYDSAYCAAGQQFHIFHARGLARAAAVLKAELDANGLLPVTRLMHRETASAWRCFYSPLPDEIARLVHDETP